MAPISENGASDHGPSDNDGVPQTANDWLIALADRPDNHALRRQFDSWLAASERHRLDWEDLSRATAAIRQAGPQSEAVWSQFAAQRQAARKAGRDLSQRPSFQQARHRRRIGLATAALALAAALAVFVLPGVALRLQADHVAETAAIKLVTLADGSVMTLAPQSAVSVSFSDGQRNVRLLRGEAFFDVAPDADRPFKVQAGKALATVLGTAFDTRLRGEGVDVAVEHGLVQVEFEATSRRLGAGDWLRMDPGQAPVAGKAAPAQMRAWLNGQLIARDEPVGAVVDRLRPYFAGLIVVQGEELAGRSLTGVFTLADPEAALRSIASAQKAKVQRIGPWLLIISL